MAEAGGAPAARNAGIDLLRGLAIVFVLLNHLGLPMRIPLKATALADVLPVRLLQALNYNGYEAVFVFFVISGFLIAGNALERWGSLARIDAKAFYARRFARIVPCLVALLAVLAVLHGLGVPDYTIHRPGQSLGGALLAALGLHLNWYEGHTGYLPGNWDVLWSLSIEEVFYIGFPIVCLLTRRLWVLVPLLVILALSLPVTRSWAHGNEIWLEKAYLPGMAAIATGVIGALIAARFRPSRKWVVRLFFTLGALGLATGMLAERYVWAVLGEGFMLVLTISTTCLVISMHWSQTMNPRRPLRGFGWLRSFGFHSYEIYLTHMFVVLGAVALFKAAGADMRTGYLWYVPSVLLSWLLGLAVARFFSIPCDRALRDLLLRRPAISLDRASEVM